MDYILYKERIPISRIPRRSPFDLILGFDKFDIKKMYFGSIKSGKWQLNHETGTKNWGYFFKGSQEEFKSQFKRVKKLSKKELLEYVL